MAFRGGKRIGAGLLAAGALTAVAVVPPARAAAGTEGASFLNIPVGAGPAALGSAYTALARDAYAPVYNPAGLGWLDSSQLAGQHVMYLGSSYFEYVGVAHPLRQGMGIGGSIQYLGSGKISGRDPDGNDLGTFSASFASYNFSYGQALGGRFSIGATVKWIRAQLSDVSANTMAGDIGLLCKVFPRWTVGSTLTNAGRRLTFLDDGDALPLAWHLGTSYRPTDLLALTGEIVTRAPGPASVHMGLEWQVLRAVSWRVGYRTDTVAEQSQLAGFTTGLGIQMWGHEFAYAWVPLGELGNTQYFSLVMRFGEKVSEKRNLVSLSHNKPSKPAPVEEAPLDSEQLMNLLEIVPAK